MANNDQVKPAMFKRELILVQFKIYRRIVERKHGIAADFLTDDEIGALSDEVLLAYVDSLKDMAHLPPV